MRSSLTGLLCALLVLALTGCTVQYAERAPAERETDVETEEAPASAAQHEDEEPDLTPTPTATPAATPTPTPEPEPTPTPTPSAEEALVGVEWIERGRLTVLLAGTDPGFYHAGSRTDAIMVASVDLETGHVALFGIPRSFGDIRLPEHISNVLGYSTYTSQINALYRLGENNPGLFPEATDPGMHILQGAVQELLGIPIDYYAKVNMQGFVQVIDAFGGVKVNVREQVQVRLLSPEEGVGFQQFNIQPGEQTLNGEEALAYARSRTGTTDYDRMERQRCIVASAIDQAELTTLLRTFPELIDAVQQYVVTNVPLEQLPDMVMLRDRIQSDHIISIGFNPPDFVEGRTEAGHERPAYSAIQETVQHVFADPNFYIEGGEMNVLDDRHC